MSPIHHTYIFESGMWEKIGESFVNKTQQTYPLKETVLCERNARCWRVVSEKTILRNPPLHSTQHLDMQQDAKMHTWATWSLEHPRFGKMRGSFTVFETGIISRWSSEKGFSSYAVLTKVNETTYKENGFSFTPGEKVFEQWTAEVKKLGISTGR